MASKSQNEANRKNAARSTGPKTDRGKAASSRNATRHGLSSAGIAVLPTESEEDLNALAKTLNDEHQPQGDTECFLVHQMIAARWKLARLERLEAEAFDEMYETSYGPSDPDRRVLYEMRNSKTFDHLQRYTAAAERSYYKALRELQNLRSKNADRKKQNEADDAQAVLRDLLNDPTYARGPRMVPPYDDLQNEPNSPVGSDRDFNPRL